MSTSSSKTNYIILLLVVFGGFLVFGLSENVKGPALPKMQTEFTLSEFQLGLLLAINSLGYLVACTFTGLLSNRIGLKRTGLLAFGSMAISGVLMYLSTSYLFLTASYFLMYLANGMLEIGLAIMAARIFTRNTGTMMNLSHFFYGLSSIFAPIAASSLMGWSIMGGELGWRGMYLFILLLAVLPMLPTAAGRFPVDTQEAKDRIPLKQFFRDKIAWLIVLILSFGVISELAVGGWLVNFLVKTYAWDLDRAAGMLTLFFLFFTLSRLFVGPITDRIGYTLSIAIFSAFSGLCSFAAIAIGEQGAILFAIAGIGISPIYPTIMALLAKRYSRGLDTAITFTVTLMGVASVIGNLLIGTIIDGVRNLFTDSRGTQEGIALGMQAGYSFIALLALLCSAAALLLYILLRRRKELV